MTQIKNDSDSQNRSSDVPRLSKKTIYINPYQEGRSLLVIKADSMI